LLLLLLLLLCSKHRLLYKLFDTGRKKCKAQIRPNVSGKSQIETSITERGICYCDTIWIGMSLHKQEQALF
jgi:hypothetical protein